MIAVKQNEESAAVFIRAGSVVESCRFTGGRRGSGSGYCLYLAAFADCERPGDGVRDSAFFRRHGWGPYFRAEGTVPDRGAQASLQAGAANRGYRSAVMPAVS